MSLLSTRSELKSTGVGHHVGTDPSLSDLTDVLSGRVASYKMPKDLVVAGGALPRNAGGKVVKGVLRTDDRERAAAGA